MKKDDGFTLMEVLVVVFVIGTVVVGVMGLFILNMRTARDAERRIVAVALANERMERIRNLPYVQVGTQGGVPSGAIVQSEEEERNGVTYTIKTDIRYIDDDFDGTDADGVIREDEERVTVCHHPPGNSAAQHTMVIGSSSLSAHLAHGDTVGECGSSGGDGSESGDSYNADFKQVRVEASWPSPSNVKPVMLTTYIVPQGVESGEAGGTLDFQVLDSSGVGVEGATVTVANDTVDPVVDISTLTNSEGHVVLPGMPVAADSYEISVAKSGYSSERTYDTTAVFFPDADHTHLSLVGQALTVKTFAIDLAGSITVQTQDEDGVAVPNVAYSIKGSKTIGEELEGGELVASYKVDESAVTGASGEYLHSALEWDEYELTIDGVSSGYDIKETSSILPLQLSPGEDLDLAVTLVEYTPISLHVTAVDGEGVPIDNTTVRVFGNSFDETQGTGVPGQVLFSDLPLDGEYEVEMDAPGFSPWNQTVSVSGTTRVQISLTPST